jgi:hypothetical protein
MPITSDNVTCRFRGALTTAIEVMWNPQVGGLSEPTLCPQPTPEIVDGHINRAALRAKVEEAEFAETISRKLVEEADQALVAAQDELDGATEAHARAVRGDTLARLAKALEPAAAIDNELASQGAQHFDIEGMIRELETMIENCTTPPILDVELWTNDNGIIRRPPERAIEDVARGASFVNPRDERKYAAQVEALRTEIAVKKQAQPRVDQVG